MAIEATVKTVFGEDRQLYIRINNISASNHGVDSTVLARGFLSKQAFEDGKHYVWEQSFDFSADVSKPLWGQAYDHIKSLPELSDAVDC